MLNINTHMINKAFLEQHGFYGGLVFSRLVQHWQKVVLPEATVTLVHIVYVAEQLLCFNLRRMYSKIFS